jgi:Ca2+-binding RTX toxin-like protein
LHVVTNEYAGTAGVDVQAGSNSNDLISGLAGNDTLTGLAGSDIIRGGAGIDSIDGGADDDQLYGGDGNDTVIGGTGNDYLYGELGDDNLQGGDGADKIYGGAGTDTIVGGIGADLISGGAGNDSLTGNAGADTFKWDLADKGLKGAPALDIITDFDPAAFGAGGDVLDLRDILSGESHVGLDSGNLENYLHFEKLEVGVGVFNTIVHISSNGEFVSGFNAGKDVQKITLTGADLVGVFTNDQDIINNLLIQQKLITD